MRVITTKSVYPSRSSTGHGEPGYPPTFTATRSSVASERLSRSTKASAAKSLRPLWPKHVAVHVDKPVMS